MFSVITLWTGRTGNILPVSVMLNTGKVSSSPRIQLRVFKSVFQPCLMFEPSFSFNFRIKFMKWTNRVEFLCRVTLPVWSKLLRVNNYLVESEKFPDKHLKKLHALTLCLCELFFSLNLSDWDSENSPEAREELSTQTERTVSDFYQCERGEEDEEHSESFFWNIHHKLSCIFTTEALSKRPLLVCSSMRLWVKGKCLFGRKQRDMESQHSPKNRVWSYIMFTV